MYTSPTLANPNIKTVIINTTIILKGTKLHHLTSLTDSQVHFVCQPTNSILQ